MVADMKVALRVESSEWAAAEKADYPALILCEVNNSCVNLLTSDLFHS